MPCFYGFDFSGRKSGSCAGIEKSSLVVFNLKSQPFCISILLMTQMYTLLEPIKLKRFLRVCCQLGVGILLDMLTATDKANCPRHHCSMFTFVCLKWLSSYIFILPTFILGLRQMTAGNCPQTNWLSTNSICAHLVSCVQFMASVDLVRSFQAPVFATITSVHHEQLLRSLDLRREHDRL